MTCSTRRSNGSIPVFCSGHDNDFAAPQPPPSHNPTRFRTAPPEARPSDSLMARQKTIPRAGVRRFPDKPMSPHGLHSWWYRCLARAGIVPEGAQSGERMHKARHAAGQRVLDRTGNLKAVQKLLGQASIQTTGDVYADGDIDQLARTQVPANPRNRRATSGDGGNRTRATFPRVLP